MKLEDQLPTLQQCKHLKELGYPQEALFYWVEADSRWDPYYRAEYDTWADQYEKPSMKESKHYAAPTVAEMGEVLPRNFASFFCGMDLWRVANTFNYATGNDIYHGAPVYTGGSKTFVNITATTEAQVRAELLIWLFENKLFSTVPKAKTS